MRIGCSRCQTQYDLPDERLERGAAKIRCTQCGHVFVVKRRSPEPPQPVNPPEARFDDFHFDLSAPGESSPPPTPPKEAASWEELGFDLGSPEFSQPTEETRPGPRPAAGGLDLGAFDLGEPGAAGESVSDDPLRAGASSRVETPTPERASASSPKEAAFDDFDFGSFEEPGVAPGKAGQTTEGPGAEAEQKGEEEFFSSTDDLPSLGELDLGEFDSGAGAGFDQPSDALAEREELPEPTERVRKEDLVSPPLRREVPLQGVADEIPRLDLQRGPRRPESKAAPPAFLARDRRKSPLFWVLIVAVLGTGGYTAYNAYRHPEAFTAFNPQRIRELWRNRDVEAKFATEDVKGYAQDLPGGRRVFVIRGRIVNKSRSAQGLIRVKGNLFGRDGGTLTSAEVYCGNQLSDRELAVLPRATIEARLQNQVGEALSNVDVAPGGKVPFMIVFSAPSAKVENFNVLVSAWRGGGS